MKNKMKNKIKLEIAHVISSYRKLSEYVCGDVVSVYGIAYMLACENSKDVWICEQIHIDDNVSSYPHPMRLNIKNFCVKKSPRGFFANVRLFMKYHKKLKNIENGES